MTARRAVDERVIRRDTGPIGYLGPFSSSFTLAWLATHRDRLRTLILGGRRLSVLLIWDTKGGTYVDHDDEEVAAIKRLVYGPAGPNADGGA